MRKSLFTFLLVLYVQSALGQIDTLSVNPNSDGFNVDVKADRALSELELKEATQLYLAMTKTEGYKAAKEAMLEFVAKKPPKDIKDVQDLRTRVAWNLSSTKFSSADEAVEMYQNHLDLYAKQAEEHKELFELISRASLRQLRIIFQPELLGLGISK